MALPRSSKGFNLVLQMLLHLRRVPQGNLLSKFVNCVVSARSQLRNH